MKRRGISLFLSILLLVGHVSPSRAFAFVPAIPYLVTAAIEAAKYLGATAVIGAAAALKNKNHTAAPVTTEPVTQQPNPLLGSIPSDQASIEQLKAQQNAAQLDNILRKPATPSSAGQSAAVTSASTAIQQAVPITTASAPIQLPAPSTTSTSAQPLNLSSLNKPSTGIQVPATTTATTVPVATPIAASQQVSTTRGFIDTAAATTTTTLPAATTTSASPTCTASNPAASLTTTATRVVQVETNKQLVKAGGEIIVKQAKGAAVATGKDILKNKEVQKRVAQLSIWQKLVAQGGQYLTKPKELIQRGIEIGTNFIPYIGPALSFALKAHDYYSRAQAAKAVLEYLFNDEESQVLPHVQPPAQQPQPEDPEKDKSEPRTA